MIRIDATGLTHRKLNEKLRQEISLGKKEIVLKNVLGQRFIAAGLRDKVQIRIEGIAGNDLGAFMDGPEIFLYGNGEDGIGNTMSGGKITIYGDAGDILGHSIRGGKIFVKGNIGWRGGIHAKSYQDKFPVIIIGGKAGDYLGEYLAGGLIIVLGLSNNQRPLTGKFLGTGMHGGTIYLRNPESPKFLGKEVTFTPFTENDQNFIQPYLEEFAWDFGLSLSEIFKVTFQKFVSRTSRPYGRFYAY